MTPKLRLCRTACLFDHGNMGLQHCNSFLLFDNIEYWDLKIFQMLRVTTITIIWQSSVFQEKIQELRTKSLFGLKQTYTISADYKWEINVFYSSCMITKNYEG